MRALSFLLGVMGVIALLTLGTSSAWATAAAPMTCHEMTSDHAGMAMGSSLGDKAPSPQKPTPASSKSSMIMGCCAACVTPAVLLAAPADGIRYPQPQRPTRAALPPGRIPSPEPGPPRHPS